MTRRGPRGFTLAEALASLAVLGIVLLLGSGFFTRRRVLERDRLEREAALRCLESEWAIVRGAATLPQGESPFLGPAPFAAQAARRHGILRVAAADLPGLVRVRLEIDAPRGPRIVEEGLVRRPGTP